MRQWVIGAVIMQCMLFGVPAHAAQTSVTFNNQHGRVAIFRDYNYKQKTMMLCTDTCRQINNESHIVTKDVHPYYVNIGDKPVDLKMMFEVDPERKPSIEALPPARTLTAGGYEDNNPNIIYEGSWVVQHRDGPSENQVHTTGEKSSAASFSFEGTGFELGIVRYDDRLSGQLCVDKKCQDIDLFSYDLKWKQPFAVMGLKNGLHDVTYRLKNGKAIDVDWLKIFGQLNVLTNGEYPSTHDAIQRTSIDDDRQPQQLAFKYSGKNVGLVFDVSNDTGETVICLDGICHVHDLISYRPAQKEILLKAKSNGEHVVTIAKGRTRYVRLSSIHID